MEKIKLLGIAPYEGLKILMQEAVSRREDMELTVYVGDLEQGVRIVESTPPQDYDVILSRGGTAELLRKHTKLPIVEMKLTVYDLLRTMHLVKDFTGGHAVVGFAGITASAYILKNLLQMNIDIQTIHRQEDVEPLLIQLKAKGCRMVIGDMVTCRCAQELSMDNILITSGLEGIEEALERAASYCVWQRACRRENQLLRSLMGKERLAVFDESGKMAFCNLSTEERGLLADMRKERASVIEKGTRVFTRKSREQAYAYHVCGTPLETEDGCRYAVFSVQGEEECGGITYLSSDQVERGAEAGFSENRLHSLEIQHQLRRGMELAYPMILLGEEGIGKESLVQLLYLRSAYRVHPLCVIDCTAMLPKNWSYLFKSVQSPLNGDGQMIFISHCERMEADVLRQLMPFLEDTGLMKRNKVIFSFTQSGQDQASPLYEHLMKRHCGLAVYLPPLRQSMGDVYNLVSLSISGLNKALGTQIIGMDNGALRLIQEEPWPSNYTQFKNVLTAAMLLSTGNIISEQTLREVLRKEHAQRRAAGQDADAIDLSKTLAQQTRSIIRLVLERENQNQSRAAKSLGISRSTLWRMLREENDCT